MSQFLQGSKTTNKFIRYAIYGMQNHVILNNYGVAFTANVPLDHKVYDSIQEAKDDSSVSKFYAKVTEVQQLLEISKSFSF